MGMGMEWDGMGCKSLYGQDSLSRYRTCPAPREVSPSRAQPPQGAQCPHRPF